MSAWRSTAALKGQGPDLLARGAALERARDFPAALEAYETALRRAPGDAQVLAALAACAGRMDMHETAAELWAQVAAVAPDRLDAIDGQARAWRELGRFDPAIALLREAILARPQEAKLWNALGVALTQAGRAEEAIAFLDEAVRLDGRDATPVYNRGGARFDLGDLAGAEADYRAALRLARKPSDIAQIQFTAAVLALAKGDLAAGWEAYEARHARHLASAVAFDTALGRRWEPGMPLAGRRLLLVGEQGLGDEIMFASLVPDVIEALGPEGRLTLAVEPRLTALFARSFPTARVIAHMTEPGRERSRRTAPGLARPGDLWAPLGSMTRRFRAALADFPDAAYLQPDPARVAAWRAWLGEGPPAVGISWRSGKMLGDRRRQYPPPEHWRLLLATPGVRFVNVQYGDCAEELAAFRAGAGCQILEAPGLDLRDDIEGLAALCAALDLTVCVANATGALAGACGAPAVLISPPAAWPRLGTDRLPWYPQAQTVTAAAFGAWGPAMAQAAARVAQLAATPARPR
jgi:tetratricopeptide (TPR) repeat protein